MPKLEEALIDRLALRPEVRENARALLRTVQSKTGPGTGYDIGEAKTGLPAICAYIASKSAGYADITQQVAQKASCLAPKTFTATLTTVKAALLSSKTPNGSPSKSGDEVDPSAYATLIREHEIGQPLRVESWMKEAQAALIALPRFRKDFASRVAESGAEVRIAVFFWVCRAIKLSTVQHVPLVDKYGVSLKVFSRLVKAMEDECSDLKESICATVREMRQKKARAEPPRTASLKTPSSTRSRSQSASPTKSALRNASARPSLADSAKRKVAFSLSDASASEDDFAPETPSKRPRRTFATRTHASASPAPRVMPVGKAADNAEWASSPEEAEDVEMMSDGPAPPRLVASEPVAGPSTPRRPRVASTPTHAYRTPPSARTQTLSLLSDEEDVDEQAASAGDDAEASEDDDTRPPSRRFRPVFLDRAQWVQRAPSLARDRAAAERWTQELVKRWGHPFELLGRVTASGSAS
ncbi:hypothetical protein F5148DRAFT_1292335 [Russula earlei]|uniref:Uncharacterized protein n=1 Tax=Russula earlei TaxID=71964 RepID=A0ACC0TU55_9AGAM|nr:hypothetical protein F5148DRAFT_1292335 [Russula earlei]